MKTHCSRESRRTLPTRFCRLSRCLPLIVRCLRPEQENKFAAGAKASSGSQGTQPVRQDDSTATPAQQTVTLSPEIKQASGEDVKAQIAAEQNAAGQNS